MVMGLCVHMFYLANSTCPEFRGNTAKNTQHCSRPTKTLDVSESSSSYLACHNKQVKIKDLYTITLAGMHHSAHHLI